MKKLFYLMGITSLMIGASGCGDAFRRENFASDQQQPVQAGFTRVTFGRSQSSAMRAQLPEVGTLSEQFLNPVKGIWEIQSLPFAGAPAAALTLFLTSNNDQSPVMGVAAKRFNFASYNGKGASWNNIPNGKYTFAFVGSDNATLDSTIQCSLGTTNPDYTTNAGEVISLTGADANVYLHTGGCGSNASSAFRTSSYTALDFGVCGQGTSDSQFGALAVNSACPYHGVANFMRVVYSDYDVPLLGKLAQGNATAADLTPDASNSLFSPCVALGSSPVGVTGTALNVVAGNIGGGGSKVHLRTFVYTYKTANTCDPNTSDCCPLSQLQNIVEFPKGLAACGGTGGVVVHSPSGVVLTTSAAVKFVDGAVPRIFFRELPP